MTAKTAINGGPVPERSAAGCDHGGCGENGGHLDGAMARLSVRDTQVSKVRPDRRPGRVELLRRVVDDIDVKGEERERSEQQHRTESDCTPRSRRTFL